MNQKLKMRLRFCILARLPGDSRLELGTKVVGDEIRQQKVHFIRAFWSTIKTLIITVSNRKLVKASDHRSDMI